MTQEQIQINNIYKTLGVSLITSGVTFAKGTYKVSPVISTFSSVQNALSKVELNFPATQLDNWYAYLSWQDWQEVLPTIINLMKNFPWTAEYFDCDNRANMVLNFANLLTGTNSIGRAYVEIYNKTTGTLVGLHYCNLIVDKDQNVYLFDIDNGGGTSTQILFDTPITIGNWLYSIKSAVFF